MANLWNLSIYLCVSMIATIMMNVFGFEPSLHRVGGGQYTWKPDVNFSDWSSHEHFFTGDWLFFGFDRVKYNVLQVNRTAYEQCIETGFISNVTRGGRDVFQLVQTKPYYFICGRGYCQKGMKLAVNVLPQPPPASSHPVTPSRNSSSATTPHPKTYAAAFTAITFSVLFACAFA